MLGEEPDPSRRLGRFHIYQTSSRSARERTRPTHQSLYPLWRSSAHFRGASHRHRNRSSRRRAPLRLLLLGFPTFWTHHSSYVAVSTDILNLRLTIRQFGILRRAVSGRRFLRFLALFTCGASPLLISTKMRIRRICPTWPGRAGSVDRGGRSSPGS